MNRVIVLFLGIAVAVISAHHPKSAVIKLDPHDISTRNVTGEILLTQPDEYAPVKLTGKVYGLTEGPHGFHIHEKGDLRMACTSAAAHFNPYGVNHGAPDSAERHVGDLGNIVANAQGEATIDILDNQISLSGPHSIIGRAVVVHSMEDDLGKGNHPLSKTTGNSGDRWACGIIGIL